MKKRRYTKKLSRNFNQRKALFRNLLVALFTHNHIQTTKAKAKAIQRLADKIITKGKQNTLHARRQVHKILQDKTLVHKIFTDIAKKYAKRSGGYTKITYLYHRRGDNALIVNLSLLDVASHKTSSSPSSPQPQSTSKPKSSFKPQANNQVKSKTQQNKSHSKPSKTSSTTKKEVK